MAGVDLLQGLGRRGGVLPEYLPSLCRVPHRDGYLLLGLNTTNYRASSTGFRPRRPLQVHYIVSSSSRVASSRCRPF